MADPETGRRSVHGSAAAWSGAHSPVQVAALAGRVVEHPGSAGGVADLPAGQAFWTTVLGYVPGPCPGLTEIHHQSRLGPVLVPQPLGTAVAAGGRLLDGVTTAGPPGP